MFKARRFQNIKVLIAILPWVAVALAGWARHAQQRVAPARLIGGGVNGDVCIQSGGTEFARPSKATRFLFLPDFLVRLKNLRTGALTVAQKTDLYGRYYFPVQPPGVYQLVWDAQRGWASGALPQRLIIKSGTIFPKPALIQTAPGFGIVVGDVKFADGGTPFFQDEYFGITNTAVVTITRRSLRRPTIGGSRRLRRRGLGPSRVVTLGQARANFMGEFAIPCRHIQPPFTGLFLGATDEAARVSKAMPLSSVGVFPTQGPGSNGLVLKNSKPNLDSAFALSGSTGTRFASAGATMPFAAQASDRDGDTLKFRWKLPASSGTLTNFTPLLDQGEWQLPTKAGDYKAYVVVGDGKGGYARGNMVLKVGQTEASFSGHVVDDAGSPVEKASVEINGVVTTTDSAGSYSLKTPLSDRYVMNIVHEGFAHLSQVFHGEANGQLWELVRVQEFSGLDPSTDIKIVDNRPILERRKMRGAEIDVPAESLVREDGAAIQPPLTAEIATLDVSRGEAPGDWGAMEGGHETNLISYGCVFTEFRDSTGAKCNLAPNHPAKVRLPAPSSLLNASPPITTPFWSYDEKDGFWKVSGDASLDASGHQYRGIVRHFSTINTDLSKVTASCLRVVLDPTISVGVKLRVSDPSGTHFTQSFTFVTDDVVNAVYRLIPNIPVKLEVLDPTTNNPLPNVSVEETLGLSAAGGIVDSGNPIPAGHTLWPARPYDDCKTVYVRLAVPNSPGDFLVFKDVGNQANADRYYATVDPQNQRLTLGSWWTANGFDTLGQATGSVAVGYLNDNDLGSGRDMHFLQKTDGTVAAYVTNYGGFDQNPDNATYAASHDAAHVTATVCMEYSPIEGPTPGSSPATGATVKFYVYNGGDASAPRQGFADLDGFGPKFVPNLCLNCHGGDYHPSTSTPPPATEAVIQARFRELDYSTFKFPGSATPSLDEKTRLHQQNTIVRGVNGDELSSQAIKDLVDGWYAGGGDDQDATYAPSGWKLAGHPEVEQLYHDVVAKSCRTCHISFGNDDPNTGINWNTYAQFKTYSPIIPSIVLTSRRMPHAKITYKNFWLSSSPSRSDTIKNFTFP